MGMTPYYQAYFEIRASIRDGRPQFEAIEKFGDAFGRKEHYRYLLQIASEQHSIAQAA
jgi:hypothetical protein